MNRIVRCWVAVGMALPGFFPVASRAAELSIDSQINALFTPLVAFLEQVLFWDPFGEWGIIDLELGVRVPLVLFWLSFGAIFFTIYLRFINLRGFKHALELIAGRYHDPSQPGQISHFQALATALSGTVGLGNIGGVAIAVSIGGPGATLWMILLGLFGMCAKFAECTLGVKYRYIDENGKVFGGPMHYLSKGLEKRSMGGLGKVLAVLFCVMCIGGALGVGNMLQANQAYQMTAAVFPAFDGYGAWFGLILAVIVGVVIIGGITGIADVTKRVVPLMFMFYLLAATYVIAVNIEHLGQALLLIYHGALNPDAAKGGFIGVMVIGLQRAASSNEAGVGSASIAHSAVATREPVSEGTVALLEPFIDTVVICTMTALVLIFTGFAIDNPDNLSGVQLTNAAFSSELPWFSWVLWPLVLLFAFSTILAWSYYGLQSWNYLFGRHSGKRWVELSYSLFFLMCVIIGAASSLSAVVDFSDMMVIGMAFPNLVGLLIMAKEVRGDMQSYFQRLAAGQISRY